MLKLGFKTVKRMSSEEQHYSQPHSFVISFRGSGGDYNIIFGHKHETYEIVFVIDDRNS